MFVYWWVLSIRDEKKYLNMDFENVFINHFFFLITDLSFQLLSFLQTAVKARMSDHLQALKSRHYHKQHAGRQSVQLMYVDQVARETLPCSGKGLPQQYLYNSNKDSRTQRQ